VHRMCEPEGDISITSERETKMMRQRLLGPAHQQLSEAVRIAETPTEWAIEAESIMSRRPRMAFAFKGQFDSESEARMRGYYETLSEKDGRRFAVLQAKLLGYGGITY